MNEMTHRPVNTLMPLRPLAVLMLALGLTACSLTPKYERPESPVASSWPSASGEEASKGEPATLAADVAWQSFVSDAQLRELIGLSLQNNRDLRMAIQSLEQARAQYQIARTSHLPTVGANFSGTRQSPSSSGASGVSGSAMLGVGISDWEIDFFGRVQSLKDAALSQYLATEEARKSAQISLIAGVASAWVSLKTDTDLLVLAERTALTRKQSLDLTKLRFDNGVSSALDMRQAESLLSAAEATRAAQQRARALDINLLTLLVGQTIPANLLPEVPVVKAQAAPVDLTQPTAAPVLPQSAARFVPVPEGLPSDLLTRRPDIRQAEYQLMAANANIGAARAAFFPRISLTASLGRVSGSLGGLFGGSGGMTGWALSPALVLPIFDAGRNQANLEVSQAQRDLAVSQYEKTIQMAFREVADALASRTALSDQAAALQRQSEAERDRFRLADLRYRNGIASYLDMLDAQRSLFATEQALAQIQLARQQNEVLLYKALGGGWGPDDEAQAQAEAGQKRQWSQAK